MIHDLPRTLVLTVKKTWHKWEQTRDHLAEHGIASEPFIGMDRTICRLEPVFKFEVNAPNEKLGIGPLCACLTHYMAWMVMSYQPEDSFWVLEDDAVFVENWRWIYSHAMEALPSDWDVVFLGSCCTNGTMREFMNENLQDVRYPMCGHAMMYRKKALGTLLKMHQKVWAPLDIAMKFDSLPHLKVYTVVPRIFEQRGSFIPE